RLLPGRGHRPKARRRRLPDPQRHLRDRGESSLPVSWNCPLIGFYLLARPPALLPRSCPWGNDRMTADVTRRTVLRGLRAALALQWMESLPAVARAATSSSNSRPPVRMCFWYVPNGVHLPAWFPQQAGPLVDLPESLRPLSFAREYLNTFHGLTHNTALTNGDSEGCGHGQGSASFLTGAQAYKTQDAVRVGISVDQLYARHVGNETPFPTIDLRSE